MRQGPGNHPGNNRRCAHGRPIQQHDRAHSGYRLHGREHGFSVDDNFVHHDPEIHRHQRFDDRIGDLLQRDEPDNLQRRDAWTSGGNQIFVFENGAKIGGTVTVNGTIDVYQGTFTQGNSALTVNAPADKADTYNGIAIMEPSSNTTSGTCKDGLGLPCLQLQFGSGSGVLNGIVYAPTSQVYQQDNGGGTVVTGVIAYQIYLKASSMDVTNSYNAANPSTTPLSKVSLVE